MFPCRLWSIALSVACFSFSLVAQPLTVLSVSPANGAKGVSCAEPVVLTFSAPLNPLTVTAQSVRVGGRWSGPLAGSLTVNGAVVTFSPSRPLFASEIATLAVARTVGSVGGNLLVNGFASTWWTDCAASSGVFAVQTTVPYRMPGEGLVRTYGFFAGDVDRDGSPDMSAANEVSYDVRLLKNDGCGNFGPITVTPLPSGVEPSPNEGADFNGDGWLDLATGNQNGNSVSIFLNSGTGTYLAPVQYSVSGQVHGLSVGDIDSDGDVDVLAPNLSNIAVLRNNGNGTFAAATYFNGGGNGEWAIALADFNSDGRLDVASGNFFDAAVAILLGDGLGTFTFASSRSLGGTPWSMTFGEFNGDGALDLLVALNNVGQAAVLLNNGTGGMSVPTLYAVGSLPVSADVGDVEGDDDLDIIVGAFGGANATVWRNNGAGGFGNSAALPSTTATSCAVVLDHDRDGDTDIIVTDELDDTGRVYRQTGPAPAGVQAPSCDAALRINSQAMRGGFGGRPATSLPGGRTVFVSVSGAPSRVFLIAVGNAVEPGAMVGSGLVNLQLSPLPAFLIDGFSGNPLGVLDANGESMLAFPIPIGAFSGASLTLQALVASLTVPGGAALSNPETVLFL